jgi:diguanylate cyclase (GGDEF)-like protein
MSRLQLLLVILSWVPAITLWAAFPRRRWAAWTGAAVCVVLWLGGYVAAGAQGQGVWTAVGTWATAACLYAAFVVTRNSGDLEAMELRGSRRGRLRDDLSRKVSESKARIHKIETEQREMLAIYSMLKGLSEALTWEDMRPKLDMAVRQYLGVEVFALFVVEPGSEDKLRSLVRRKTAGSPGNSWETLHRLLQERGLNLRVPHVLEKPEHAIALPIFEEQKMVGYFYTRIPKGRDAAQLTEKVETFVGELTFAFRRVNLFQEVEKVSQIDGLTGVHRRGVLDEKLEQEVVRAQTFKTSFCLMILDIDHFKSLNDRYGHPFGDHVLRRVGALLRGSVYETDFVARYGGEEFAILLPRADSEGVLRKAEAVRRAIEGEVFELAMQRVRVTASVGVAHYPRDGETAEAVVRQADQALYFAKEHGRNKVVDIENVRGQL